MAIGIAAGMLIAQGVMETVGKLVGAGIKTQQVGEKINREAMEISVKLQIATNNLAYAEQAYTNQSLSLVNQSVQAVGQTFRTLQDNYAQSYETFNLSQQQTAASEQRNRLASGVQSIQQGFTARQNSLQSSLYNQRTATAMAQYENDVAQDRLNRRSQSMAQTFFQSFLPGLGSSVGKIASGASNIKEQNDRTAGETVPTGGETNGNI